MAVFPRRTLRLEPLEPRLLLSAVTAEDALLAASTFMTASGQLSASNSSALSVQPLQDASGADLAYVVQRASGGYVVVAGDNAIDPIVAYSWTGSLTGQSPQDNPLVDMIDGDMAARLQADGASSSAAAQDATSQWAAYLSNAPALMTSLSSVDSPYGPWIAFPTFDQVAPYNDFAPVDPASGERDPVGCVATSMAQIAYYWNYPQSLSFSSADAYTTTTDGIRVPGDSQQYGFPDFSTLNAELSKINYDFSKDELAYLSLATGIKARMDYDINGSGAFMSANLYLKGLGFGSASWSTNWYGVESEVVQDVKNGWPVQLEISGLYGTHSVVVDGYSDDGAFHVNMGWGGSADAWYFLPSIVPANPELASFSRIEGAIYDITPYAAWASVSSPSTSEGNSGKKDLNFTVSLSQASSQTVTVGYSTADGTATAGSDYTAVSGTLTFDPGQTSKTVSVPIIGDTTPELNETLYLRLTGATNATIAGGEGVGTIKNDDGTPASMLWPADPFYAPPDRTLYTNEDGSLTIGGYSIGSAGELDGFHLYFDASGPVTIETTGSTATAMAIYDGAGAPIATDDGAPGANAGITGTVTAGHYYDLLVRGYQDTSTGSYGLTVKGPAPTVTPITVSADTNSGGVTGSVNAANGYAFYSFTATQGGTWTINLDPAADFRPTLMVYDDSGAPVRGNFTAPIDDGMPGAPDTYSDTLSTGQTYYIRVDGYGADTGDFTLSVQGPWPNRPANAASVSTLYTNQNGDATVPGNEIAGAGQFGIYHVAFGGAGTATFQTTGSTDTVMGYYDSAGAPALTDDESGTAQNALITTSVPAARDLELLVGGYATTTGSYGLSVDGPSAGVSPVSITPGTNYGSVSGSIGSSAESDFYSFTAPQAGSWTVTVDPASGFHPTLSVYDSAGTPIGGTFTAPLDAGQAGAHVAWTGTLSEGDTVYVRVDGLGSATGAYGLTVQGPANNLPMLTSISPLPGGVEDTAFTVSYDALLAASDLSEVGASQPLSFRVASVTSGTLTKDGSAVVPGSTLLGPGESLLWRPAANANGTLNAFTVTGWDGQYSSASPVQVQVQVQPVNDRPTAASQSVGAVMGTPLPITLSGSDVETPAGSLTCAIGSGPSHGTISLAGNVATYTPAAGFVGEDSFTFTVTDTGDPAGSGANPGDLTSAPATVSISVSPPQVGSWQRGGATVTAFDTSGPLDINPSGIRVKFGRRGAVASITLVGTQPMDGLGITISGARVVGTIRDARKGAHDDIAFIASDAPIKAIRLKSGISGYNLNGMDAGGLVLPADVDGDGSTSDLTAIYSAGRLGKVRFGGDIAGDVWLGGGFGSFASKTGVLSGDLTALGNGGAFSLAGNFVASLDVEGSLKSFHLKGGDFSGRLNVSGNLHKLSITSSKAGGGAFLAGANVTVGGTLYRTTVTSCQTDDSGRPFGIFAGQFGRVTVGTDKLAPAELPYADGDFEVAMIT